MDNFDILFIPHDGSPKIVRRNVSRDFVRDMHISLHRKGRFKVTYAKTGETVKLSQLR